MSARAARGILWALGALAILFGLATLASGGRALFGGAEARAAVGAAVPFVLWFNFLAGFAYVAAGAGLIAGRGWAAALAAGIALATIAVFGAFGLHVAAGGAHETRTVAAMTLRAGLWSAIALAAFRLRGARPGAPD